jgi:hypothetical protein
MQGKVMDSPRVMVPERRTRTIVWLWGGFGALVVVVAVALLLVTSAIDRKRQDMEVFLDKLLLERRARIHVRIVPDGKPLSGNAWEEYSLAEEQAAGFVPEKALMDLLNTGVDSPEVRDILAKGEAALDHLHRGAQRSNGQYPYKWEQEDGSDGSIMTTRQNLALLAAAKSRLLLEQGQAREAAGVLVDLLTYTGDTGRNATLFSAVVGQTVYIRYALEQVRRLVYSDKLDREGRARLAADLEALDRDFPAIGSAFVSETLSRGMTVRKHGGIPPSTWTAAATAAARTPLWRRARTSLANGFWARGLWADAVVEVGGYMRRIEALDKATFGVSQKEWSRINAEANASTNPMTAALFPNPLVTSYSVQHRTILARLRLLRSASMFRATGEVLELDDPLGGKLLHKNENGKLKIWSVGVDGKDDGGNDEKDLVLEVSPSRFRN